GYRIMHPSNKGGSSLDLKAPVRGIGKDGLKDPHQAEPVYHTSSYVRPTADWAETKKKGESVV
ncbi:hypothetical protein HDU96_010872, partial [Phlyctochytrium bullatum]